KPGISSALVAAGSVSSEGGTTCWSTAPCGSQTPRQRVHREGGTVSGSVTRSSARGASVCVLHFGHVRMGRSVAARPDAFQVHGVVAWRAAVSQVLVRDQRRYNRAGPDWAGRKT